MSVEGTVFQLLCIVGGTLAWYLAETLLWKRGFRIGRLPAEREWLLDCAAAALTPSGRIVWRPSYQLVVGSDLAYARGIRRSFGRLEKARELAERCGCHALRLWCVRSRSIRAQLRELGFKRATTVRVLWTRASRNAGAVTTYGPSEAWTLDLTKNERGWKSGRFSVSDEEGCGWIRFLVWTGGLAVAFEVSGDKRWEETVAAWLSVLGDDPTCQHALVLTGPGARPSSSLLRQIGSLDGHEASLDAA